MAEEPSPFDPNATPAAAPNAPGLVDKWKNFLSDPTTQATIMSFGASLASPMGFGATRAGHIAQAVGHAGKTASNRDAMERKDLETDSKVAAREAAADAAARRAQVAEANSNTAAVRAQAANQSASVNDELRRTRMDTERARQGEISEKIKFLELRRALFGDTEETRQELNRARTEQARASAGYSDARAADVPINTGIRQQNADTRMNDSTTRQRGMEGRLAVDAERLNVQQREGAANRQSREGVAAGRQSGSDRAAYDRYASDPLRVGPAVSFEEWKAKRGGGTGASTAPQTPAPRVPTPSQPQRPLTQPAGGASPPMQGARQAPNGKWYVERDGRYFEVVP